MIAEMEAPFPVAMGVIFCEDAPVFNRQVEDAVVAAKKTGPRDINALLRKGPIWTVE
jgi:hypothetical protein